MKGLSSGYLPEIIRYALDNANKKILFVTTTEERTRYMLDGLNDNFPRGDAAFSISKTHRRINFDNGSIIWFKSEPDRIMGMEFNKVLLHEDDMMPVEKFESLIKVLRIKP